MTPETRKLLETATLAKVRHAAGMLARAARTLGSLAASGQTTDALAQVAEIRALVDGDLLAATRALEEVIKS